MGGMLGFLGRFQELLLDSMSLRIALLDLTLGLPSVMLSLLGLFLGCLNHIKGLLADLL